ncbi:MAG: hypothetical protein ACYC9M_01135 [Desulfobulbaceae bacterium]
MKNEKKIEAGSEINSRCLKCKAVTNHTIIALVDGKVVKVLCNVCGGQHNYRPEKPEQAAALKKARPSSASANARQAKVEARFEEMVAGRDSSQALAYDMTGIFKEGDLLDHPTLGLGVVTERVMPDKIEVLFRQGSKLLICGRLCR